MLHQHLLLVPSGTVLLGSQGGAGVAGCCFGVFGLGSAQGKRCLHEVIWMKNPAWTWQLQSADVTLTLFFHRQVLVHPVMWEMHVGII